MAYRVAVDETESRLMSLAAEQTRLRAQLEEARQLHRKLVHDAAAERERDRRWAEARLRAAAETLSRKQAADAVQRERERERARVEQIALRNEVALLREAAMQLEAEVWMLADDPTAALLHYRAKSRSTQSARERDRIERIVERLTTAGR